MARVLVIDDDPSLLRAMKVGLKAGGHEVITATNGEQGISETAVSAPDVVILDLGLPDLDGLTVCRRIRLWSDVPILVLSAIDTEDRKVDRPGQRGGRLHNQALRDGRAEKRVSGRRSATAALLTATRPSPPCRPGPVELDLVHHEARIGGEPVELTAKEFDVLAFLTRHAGRTCTREMILTAVWGRGYGREAQYLHAYIHRLRQKIRDPDGKLIRTVPGVGYVLAGV